MREKCNHRDRVALETGHGVRDPGVLEERKETVLASLRTTGTDRNKRDAPGRGVFDGENDLFAGDDSDRIAQEREVDRHDDDFLPAESTFAGDKRLAVRV